MDSDEYSTSRVPPERSMPWWRIATINVLFSVSLPTLITGMDLANESSQAVFLSSILVGSVILTVIGILTSIVGCRARFSSYMLARIAFGAKGSMLLNLAFALSLIGWFGVNLNLFGDSIQRLLEAQLNYHGPAWPSELGAGFLITGTTLVGLKAINRLSMLIVPVLLVVCALLLVKSLRHESAADLLARAPATGISFGDAVSAIVGDHVPGVPRYQFSTAIDYTHPLSENVRGRWDLNGQWVGPSQGTIIHTDPDFSRPAYFVMGGNVGMQWQRFDLSLFVTNLLDQHKVLQRPNIALVEYGVTVRPRTIGLAGNYSF